MYEHKCYLLILYFVEDSLAWQEALIVEMHKKHRDEWEIMLSVLQDHDMEELRDAAETLSEKEKQTSLAQLRAKYQQLEHDDPGKNRLILSL